MEHLCNKPGGHIQEIQLNEHRTQEEQKLELYNKWLNICPNATWDDVVTALIIDGNCWILDYYTSYNYYHSLLLKGEKHHWLYRSVMNPTMPNKVV